MNRRSSTAQGNAAPRCDREAEARSGVSNTTMKNMVNGEVRLLGLDDYLALFDPSVHADIRRTLSRIDVTGAVCFENLQMDSPHLGERASLVVGPGCTYTLASACSGRLGSVPSRFQYPVAQYGKAAGESLLPERAEAVEKPRQARRTQSAVSAALLTIAGPVARPTFCWTEGVPAYKRP